MSIQHGGDLARARALYGYRPDGDPEREWVDLSTGIHPFGWPAPAIPQRLWQRLPQEDDGLEDAAATYYGVPPYELVAVPGSQAAIRLLPEVLPPRAGRSVCIPYPEYAEHAAAWQRAGHTVIHCPPGRPPEPTGAIDTHVLSNPNNPTGYSLRSSALHALQERVWQAAPDRSDPPRLVVDEAFADTAHADQSITTGRETLRGSIVVLRSMGKFFGLAGARIGFVIAEQRICDALRARLDPWAITGPTRYIARQALRDFEWQQTQRAALQDSAARLQQILRGHGLRPTGGTALYQWCPVENAARAMVWQGALAEAGVWVRRFDDPPGLRFGLPGPDAHWQRLEDALSLAMETMA